jgi:hypothetical protein
MNTANARRRNTSQHLTKAGRLSKQAFLKAVLTQTFMCAVIMSSSTYSLMPTGLPPDSSRSLCKHQRTRSMTAAIAACYYLQQRLPNT